MISGEGHSPPPDCATATALPVRESLFNLLISGEGRCAALRELCTIPKQGIDEMLSVLR